jgi:hypothetical protein
VALWGVDAAGRRAAGRSQCGECDVAGKGIALELASSPGEVSAVLQGDPAAACDGGACVRSALVAETRADDALVPAYGLLTAALFYLVAANHGRVGSLLLTLFGAATALTAALADWYENAQIRALLELAGPPPGDAGAMSEPLARLQTATAAKWVALALGVLLLATLWTKRGGWAWPLWVLRAFGAGAGLALLGGVAWAWLPAPFRTWLVERGVGAGELVSLGAALLFLFWTAAMIGAIRDAVARQPDLEERAATARVAGAAPPAKVQP